jgi:hypothetical protein
MRSTSRSAADRLALFASRDHQRPEVVGESPNIQFFDFAFPIVVVRPEVELLGENPLSIDIVAGDCL